jgi:hypothetical protein
VLFWSPDRFSREGVREALNHLQRLSTHGVGFRSSTEQYLDSCGIFKDAVLSILATIAKQERIRISERTIAGLECARKAGRIGGRRPLVVDRDKIAALDESGLTMREIAGYLRCRRLPNPPGSPPACTDAADLRRLRPTCSSEFVGDRHKRYRDGRNKFLVPGLLPRRFISRAGWLGQEPTTYVVAEQRKRASSRR